MEKNNEFNPYEFDGNINDPFFNPIAQYEQAYMYYKYLTQTVEYKIKCKEFEILCSKNNNSQSNERSQRRVE